MENEVFNLTSPQENIWLVEKFNEGTNVNTIACSIEIKNGLNEDICKEAIDYVINTNDSMRTYFIFDEKDGSNISQKFLKSIEYDVKVLDLTTYSKDEIEGTKKRLNNEPIDLKNNKLFEFYILRYNENSGCIFMKIHHIICDAWSCRNIGMELVKYMSEKTTENIIPIEAKPSYIDYIKYQDEYKNSKAYVEDRIFWNENLDGFDECVMLKKDKNVGFSKAKRFSTVICGDERNKINNYCKENKVSVYTLMLTALYTYLYRVTGKSDIIIGTPTLNRYNFKQKEMSGMFVSTLPFRTKIDDNINFLEFAKDISKKTMQLFRHQKFPYSEIVENYRKQSDIKSKLYSIILSYQNARTNFNEMENYSTKWLFNENISDQIQIHILDMDNTGNLYINYDYLCDLFEESEIKYLHDRLKTIINQAIDDVSLNVDNIDIMSEDEKNKILFDFNNTYSEYPRNSSIVELFEKQVNKTPKKTALYFEGEKITYEKLNIAANNLANYLMKEKNVKSGDIVGIMMDKSFEIIISILALLKCGVTYVPIDINEPDERVKYIISDTALKLVLCDYEKNENIFFNIKKYYKFDDKYGVSNLNMKYNSDDVVYIMYTSGTTGKPKGVMVTNRNIVRLVINQKYVEICEDDNVIQTGSPSFDATTFEYWISLLNGLTLYLIKKNDLLNVKFLKEYIDKNNISIMWLSAPLFNQIVDSNITVFENVKKLLVGGDALSVKHINKLMDYNSKITIINGYGPTENTTFSACHKINKKYEENIPIGKPITNSKCYIVDSKKRLLPINVEGELLVAGDGVSKGYLNNEKMTEEKFLKNLFGEERLYKTGDICKFNENGEIEFNGRKDFQVKINGFRVELDEIKNQFLKIEEIKDVLIYVDAKVNEKKIVAIYSENSNINEEEIIAKLKEKLPFYEIPKIMIKVNEIPLNKNGKVDMKSIKEIVERNANNNEVRKNYEYKGIYKKIYNIYEKILNRSDIMPEDNFFEIGGDSLLAIRFITSAVADDIDLTYSEFYKNPTIKSLGNYIEDRSSSISISNDIEKYDYKKIDELLQNNFNGEIKEEKYKNVLLTGATGFLGAHVLGNLIDSTKSNVYCLIRSKNNVDPLVRLKEKLNFFFKDKYDNEIEKRIFVIEGNLFEDKIVKNPQMLNDIKIDVVINCAANVKHFGDFNEFRKINEQGVENLAKFCVKNCIKLIHVSTLSVSGNILETGQVEQKNVKEGTIFNEKNMYIGQDLDNVYAYSKYLGERLVFEYIINKGLKASIMRMGNLTGRMSDGKFQPNVSDNAFSNRIKTFVELGVMPENVLDFYLEFTPIDYAADAIVKLSMIDTDYSTVYHLFNHNHVPITDIVKIFKKIGINLKTITKDEMTEIVRKKSKEDEGYKKLKGIILDINDSQEIEYKSKIKVKSNYTIDTLKELEFNWPNIDEEYVIKYMKNLIEIGFINL